MNRNSVFFRKNKRQFEKVVKLVATKDYKDEKENPIEWEFKVIDSQRENEILKTCIHRDEKGTYVDNLEYQLKFITDSCIFPELNNTELLQDYGVTLPSHLLMELVSNPYEFRTLYDRLMAAIATRKDITSIKEFEEYGE